MGRHEFLAAGGTAVIGMVHLDPLPGSPGFDDDMASIERQAVNDLEALVVGGVDAVLVENFGDAPFYPARAPAETVASMAAIARTLRERATVPIGINVLRNDALGALAVAVACGADFVRVNVLTGARLTDQGVVSGCAHELLRERRRLGADRVAVLADVAVKHSAPLADYPLEQEVADALDRGGADALIVTGPGTGRETAIDELRRVRQAAGGAPVLVGSGVTAERAATLAGEADGFIVGTAFKGDDGRVVPERVRGLVDAARNG